VRALLIVLLRILSYMFSFATEAIVSSLKDVETIFSFFSLCKSCYKHRTVSPWKVDRIYL
jgi:preprotein translocase subunit SecF